MGFEEVAHTADWALRVWAVDLPGLFPEAARGMYALAGVKPVEGAARSAPVPQERVSFSKNTKKIRQFTADAPDIESLLVAFLSELVYVAEQEKLMYTGLVVGLFKSPEGWSLKVDLEAAPIVAINKAIKAVTYHNLHIQQTARGYEAEIVFDV